jgi:hypothetical protein
VDAAGMAVVVFSAARWEGCRAANHCGRIADVGVVNLE